jgi:hypothetical protein
MAFPRPILAITAYAIDSFRAEILHIFAAIQAAHFKLLSKPAAS